MARDDTMMIRADARAMGAVTATRTRAHAPWNGTQARTQPCYSIAPDGTRTLFAPARPPRDITGQRTNRTPITKKQRIDALLMSLPTIHQEEGL